MCVCRCVCCRTFFVRVPPPAYGNGLPALCGSRLAPSAILLFLWILWPLSLFLSPSPAPLGLGLYILSLHFVSRDREIPIHALRMEGDTCIISLKTGAVNISIHALRVEGDAVSCASFAVSAAFLSTPSGWRATLHPFCQNSAQSWISIHALRAEGDKNPPKKFLLLPAYFYPRPPGGGRLWEKSETYIDTEFLSTPSGWRATL